MDKRRVLTPAQREARRLYRLEYNRANRERLRASNRARYHSKYKCDASYKQKQSQRWVEYVKTKGEAWVRARSKKYRPKKQVLTEHQRRRKNECTKNWYQSHKPERAEYARTWRRKQPLFGFRDAVRAAAASGDVRALIDKCSAALIQIDADRDSG